MSLPLNLRFTDPAAPLFIDVKGDSFETLFVISTSLVHKAHTPINQHRQTSTLKRKHTDAAAPDKFKKPMKVVQRTDAAALAQDYPSQSQSRVPGSMPPPSFNPSISSPNVPRRLGEPLFLPKSSQVSVANEEALRAFSLGIENMDADELTEMLEGDAEGVDFLSQRSDGNYRMA
jgi:cell cycle checkpoint control protein RAD9A